MFIKGGSLPLRGYFFCKEMRRYPLCGDTPQRPVDSTINDGVKRRPLEGKQRRAAGCSSPALALLL